MSDAPAKSATNFILAADSHRKEHAEVAVAIAELAAEGGVQVTLKALDQRTARQNRFLWAALSDVARQVEWHGQKMDKDSWKEFFSAGLSGQRAVPAIDGRGFIVIGQSTSRMSKRRFCDLVTLILSFGNERQVQWSDPAWTAFVAEMEGRSAQR